MKKLFVLLAMGCLLVGCDNNKLEEKSNESNVVNSDNNSKDESEDNIKDGSNNVVTEKNDKGKIVGVRYGFFDSIVSNISKKRPLKSAEGYESFYLNRVHSLDFTGDALGDVYYFDEDGYYLMDLDDYVVDEEKVASAGSWEIKNGKLILTEKYALYLVDGNLADVSVSGGETKKGLVDYNYQVVKSNGEYVFNIKHVGISSYKEAMAEDGENILADNYTLDGENWYSSEYENVFSYMNWINDYYGAMKK